MVDRQLLVFDQRDPKWKDILLGYSNTVTIGEAGCYLCALCSLLNYFGIKTTPPELNELLKANGGFAEGTALIASDDILTKFFPNIKFVQDFPFPDAIKNPDGTILKPAIPADINLLRSLMMNPSEFVILDIDEFNGNHHFVACSGVNGIVKICNSWTNNASEDFSQYYGDFATRVLKFIVYSGPVASTAAQATQPVDQATIDGLRTDRDINYNCFNEVSSYIGVPVDPNDKQGSVQKVKEKVDGYNQQIAQVTKDRDDLQAKVTSFTLQAKQLTDSNARLADLVKSQSEADSTAVDDGLKATQRLNEILSALEKLGAAVAVKLADYKSDKDFINAVIAQIIKLEENPQVSPQDHLQSIVKFLTDIGINNWLQKHKLGSVDLANIFNDPNLSQKVNAYLTELIKELEAAEKKNVSKPVKQVSQVTSNQDAGQKVVVKKPNFFSRLGHYLKSQVLTQS